MLWSRSPPATTSRSPSACCTPTPRPRTRKPSARRSPALSVRIAVSLSSDLSPKFREYERTSTVVANAYIKPIVSRYVSRLTGALKERGLTSDLFIMQSNGGLVSPELACDMPIRIVESGPAAGVLLCGVIGREEGLDRVLTFDMGGTTAKLGAIDGGEPAITPTFEVDQVRYRKGSGLPINVPAVELLEIGAGGGSIAATDMGIIKVGPESAGADPGPVCYRRGGERPTVTDANVVLGYINPDYFNGGAMRLDAKAAADAIAERIGKPLGLDAGEAAWGIHRIANANMERAMRIVSVERGRDPRKYALVAFGGAGPLHAARLARALGIPRVIIPYGAGVGSAIGMLEANSKLDASMTRLLRLGDGAETEIEDIYRQLETRVRADLARMSAGAEPAISRFAYLRYAGQGHDIRVDLPPFPMRAGYAAEIAARFEAAYLAKYGYRQPGAVVEAVDWYIVASVASASAGAHRAKSWRSAGLGIVPPRHAQGLLPRSRRIRRLRRHRPQRSARRRGHRGPRHHRGGGSHHAAAAPLHRLRQPPRPPRHDPGGLVSKCATSR